MARFFFQPKLRPQWEQEKGLGPGEEAVGDGVGDGARPALGRGEGGVRPAAACTLWCRTGVLLVRETRAHCAHW